MTKVTLRQLAYFDALAQTLHFGRAARLAGVTQPALSAQIAELEQQLGCQLFLRGGRSVRMTEDALGLLPRVSAILADVRALEQAARGGRLAMEGRLRLGLIPTIAPYLLPHALRELEARFPALRVEVQEAVTSVLVERTLAGRLDAVVAALPLDHAGLAAAELFRDRFFLAVPADDPDFVAPPVPPESPALERLMLLEEGHCMRDQALSVCGSVKPVAMASYGATSLSTLLHMVGHGLGVTMIPEMAAAVESGRAGLKLVPFAEPMPSRTVCLAWRRNSPRHAEYAEIAAALRGLARRMAFAADTAAPA